MHERKVLIQEVVRDALIKLEKQGYTQNPKQHRFFYQGLTRYCENHNNGEYSKEIGEAFIQSLRNREQPLSKKYINNYVFAVERANHIMDGESNWFPRRNLLSYEDSVFRDEVAAYDAYLRNSGKTKSDVRARMHTVARFLRVVDLSGVKSLSDLTAQNIYGAFQDMSDKCRFHRCVGAFLRYAYRHGIMEQSYSALVPSVYRHIPVPTVYSPEEVEKIIEASTMQSKVCGKRNKVIVLIAARLGLRACDIVNLRFANIRQDRGTIELTQLKTRQPLVLPLLPEIRSALDDYTENERPKSDNDHIFLRGKPPVGESIQPHTVYNIVSRIVDSSGVVVNGRKRGGHALRSSLATALLNEGYSHSDVKDALGQKSPDAIKSYVKTEVEHLRDYALPVPKPLGLFAASLGSGGRG